MAIGNNSNVHYDVIPPDLSVRGEPCQDIVQLKCIMSSLTSWIAQCQPGTKFCCRPWPSNEEAAGLSDRHCTT